VRLRRCDGSAPGSASGADVQTQGTAPPPR
jgi:hypothetical protein